MHFDPAKPIKHRETGKPVREERKDGDTTEQVIVTHGLLAIRALDARHGDDDKAKAEDIHKRFMLSTRILAALEAGEGLDLSINDAQLIKDIVAKSFVPGIWGQIWVAIDDAAKAPKPNGKDKTRSPGSP